jgi:N-acetyl-gamma-glutamyl-phosphate reductase
VSNSHSQNQKLKVAVVGASGYTGAELARILALHPHAELTIATASGERAGQKLSDLFPSLRGICDIACREYSADEIARECDFAFIALGHGKALEIAPELLERGLRVCDLGADFRLRNTDDYKQWYKLEHTAREWLQKAVYGLPEYQRENIKSAQLVANPGCYVTTGVLALAPFIAADAIKPHSIIIDAASGTSGAGRSSFSLDFHYAEVHDNYKAYGVASHRHTPEIEQGLNDAACVGSEAAMQASVTFTPHLLPIARGILATSYAAPFGELAKNLSAENACEILRARYENEPFVRVLPVGTLPSIKNIIGSNFCDIGVAVDARTERLIVISATDNLVKGASGQAVQNMNIMCEFDEMSGLKSAALFP